MRAATPARDTVGQPAPAAPSRLLDRIGGHRGGGAGSTTARELTLRHRLLLGLSAALTLALFLSYEGVHGDADPLRTDSAPAVLAIDTAHFALTNADDEARSRTPSIDEMQTQISVASQSLAAAAADVVGGASGRQTLNTVTGLIAGYTANVYKALGEPDGSPLRRAYLHYARSMLRDKDTGILPRLETLQKRQLALVNSQTRFGWSLWLGWSVALLLVLTLAAALLETQVFLRRRFHRRYSRPLLAAGALLGGGTVTLVLFTLWTHQGMADTRHRLPGGHGSDIPEVGRQVADHLANTGFRAAAAVWILIGGIVLMALTDSVLRRHLNDYRFVPR
ncbi:hypothetical protein ACFY0F_19790 [Streptomyces sp. NPDC001544]|uniref:hypothetical protein n=1 Tax=Streptomyces sp. NPDC001544 TaxID=3364584 RepID=UPI0036903CB9